MRFQTALVLTLLLAGTNAVGAQTAGMDRPAEEALDAMAHGLDCRYSAPRDVPRAACWGNSSTLVVDGGDILNGVSINQRPRHSFELDGVVAVFRQRLDYLLPTWAGRASWIASAVTRAHLKGETSTIEQKPFRIHLFPETVDDVTVYGLLVERLAGR